MANQTQNSSKESELHQKQMSEILQSLPVQIRSAEFAQALEENSNLALEWCWVATKVTHPLEAAYCYHKALVIWPESQEAKQALATLEAARTDSNAPSVPAKSGRIFGFGRQMRSAQ